MKLTTRLPIPSDRELVLAAVVIAGLALLAVHRWVLMPSYVRWSSARAQAELLGIENAKLRSLIRLRQEVIEQHELLPREAFVSDTPQITMSQFLRQLERAASRAGVTIVNASPLDSTEGPEHQLFPLRIGVSGPLAGVARLAESLLNGPAIVGLESTTIRATRAADVVDCQLSIWLVGLRPLSVLEGDGG